MVPILMLLLLIVVNGIFVMAEMSVISSRKPRLQQLANEGNRGAHAALELATQPDRFLATTQIGITLIAILTGAYGERTLTERLSMKFLQVPRLAEYSETIAFAIVVVAITYVSLVIGELLPKRLALYNPERIASAMARLMNFLSRLGAPAQIREMSEQQACRLNRIVSTTCGDNQGHIRLKKYADLSWQR